MNPLPLKDLVELLRAELDKRSGVYLEIIKLASKRYQDLPGPAGSAEILFGFYSDFIGILFDFI